MKSHTTPEFWNQFKALPQRVQEDAKKAFRLFLSNPVHPGLEFKKLQGNTNSYSVRVGAHYRAVGEMTGDAIVWFWIGTHAEYDRRF
jgi:mRNA-degrading endonuclease RelE of RelBE toxin-antitoxin system